VRGDTVVETLSYVGFDPRQFQPRVERDCERAVEAGRITVEESRRLLRFYAAELNGYTYLNATPTPGHDR
jgi:arginine decarboxylase